MLSAQLTLTLYRRWTKLRARLFTQLVKGGFYRFGKASMIQLPTRLCRTERISIGDGVFIGPGSWLEVRVAGASGPVISIGDRSATTGYLTITAACGVHIEKDVLFARYVYISDHMHKHSDRNTPVMVQGITGVARVRIKEGAWLGQSVVVCPGVTIGRNAVIGANSVVRHDVPDFCVAAGVPARVLREVDQVHQR
jgi:acetyltransferase-like isoleucine patch superfamily enzyme